MLSVFHRRLTYALRLKSGSTDCYAGDSTAICNNKHRATALLTLENLSGAFHRGSRPNRDDNAICQGASAL